MNKLKQNSKSMVLSSALGISSLFYTGCETAEDTAWISTLFGANAALATTPAQAVAWGALAQGAQTTAIIQGQREAAEASRSQVNVYYESKEEIGRARTKDEYGERRENNTLGSYKKIHPEFSFIIFTTYNFDEDFDRDGKIMFPDEFFNIKHKFAVDEKITVRCGAGNLIPNISYKLLNKNGEVVDEYQLSSEGFSYAYGVKRVYNTENTKKLSAGEYLAVWYSNEEYLGKIKFEVDDEISFFKE